MYPNVPKVLDAPSGPGPCVPLVTQLRPRHGTSLCTFAQSEGFDQWRKFRDDVVVAASKCLESSARGRRGEAGSGEAPPPQPLHQIKIGRSHDRYRI